MDATVNARVAPIISGSNADLAPGNALVAGHRLREFEIVETLGEGGFSIVYGARDVQLMRDVAIKEYIPISLAGRVASTTVRIRSEHNRETFEAGLNGFINEARLLAQFKHPGLVEVLQFWEENGTAYMVMPRYTGKTLRSVLKDMGGRGDEPWLRGIVAPVLDVLELLHSRNVFHRDIAPDNILIKNDGTPVLLDLGSAREVVTGLQKAITVVVKPGYAPIEQYSSDFALPQGPWTDVYAVGALLHFAIVGTPPPASISRIMKDSLQPLAAAGLSGYSREFLGAVDRALALQPAERPQSIAELRDLLRVTEHDKTVIPLAAPEPIVVAGPAPVAAEPVVVPVTSVPLTSAPPLAGGEEDRTVIVSAQELSALVQQLANAKAAAAAAQAAALPAAAPPAPPAPPAEPELHAAARALLMPEVAAGVSAPGAAAKPALPEPLEINEYMAAPPVFTAPAETAPPLAAAETAPPAEPPLSAAMDIPPPAYTDPLPAAEAPTLFSPSPGIEPPAFAMPAPASEAALPLADVPPLAVVETPSLHAAGTYSAAGIAADTPPAADAPLHTPPLADAPLQSDTPAFAGAEPALAAATAIESAPQAAELPPSTPQAEPLSRHAAPLILPPATVPELTLEPMVVAEPEPAVPAEPQLVSEFRFEAAVIPPPADADATVVMPAPRALAEAARQANEARTAPPPSDATVVMAKPDALELARRLGANAAPPAAEPAAATRAQPVPAYELDPLAAVPQAEKPPANSFPEMEDLMSGRLASEARVVAVPAPAPRPAATAAATPPAAKRPVPAAAEPRRPSNPRWIVPVCIAAAVLIVIGVAWFLLSRPNLIPTPPPLVETPAAPAAETPVAAETTAAVQPAAEANAGLAANAPVVTDPVAGGAAADGAPAGTDALAPAALPVEAPAIAEAPSAIQPIAVPNESTSPAFEGSGQTLPPPAPPPPVELPPQPVAAAPAVAPAGDAVKTVDVSGGNPRSEARDEAAARARDSNAGRNRRDAAKPAMATTGNVKLSIQPWGEVWVNGSLKGVSPPMRFLQLEPGTYNIELRNPGLQSARRQLTVTAGQPTSLEHRFQAGDGAAR